MPLASKNLQFVFGWPKRTQSSLWGQYDRFLFACCIVRRYRTVFRLCGLGCVGTLSRSDQVVVQPTEVRVEGRLTSMHACFNSQCSPRSAARAGFGLIDLLVSIAIVVLLIAITLPSMSKVRESARRVVCGSNLRQVGLGVQMYADDFESNLPWSVYLGRANDGSDDLSAQMNQTRVSGMKIATFTNTARKTRRSGWDGLGVLFEREYLSASETFYCPSHHGEHPFARYSGMWGDQSDETIVSNFQYRGRGPTGSRDFDQISPTSALVSDSLSSLDDFNHRVGANVLRAGLWVKWVPENETRGIVGDLNQTADPDGGSVSSLWDTLDLSGSE